MKQTFYKLIQYACFVILGSLELECQMCGESAEYMCQWNHYELEMDIFSK